MLTVKEINEVSFGKAGFSGYKPEDVDNFIDQVAASFQELLTQRDAAVKQANDLAAMNNDLSARNGDSQKKLAILAQKVEKYRQEEEGIKEAILNAQRMSKNLVQEAQSRADSILRDAREQADVKLRDADEEARRITSNAANDAAKAAREYAQQVDAKKSELEEVKRQVTAFRASLLEMYKKHLECIDHIPVFRQKEDRAEKSTHTPEPEPVAEVPAREEPEKTMIQEKRPEPIPANTTPEPQPEPQPVSVPAAPQPVQQPRERQPVYHQPPVEEPAATRPAVRSTGSSQPVPTPTLNDRVNYVQEQLQPSQPPEDYLEDNDLSSVGIDLNAYSNIPETLRKEKSTNYSHLEFGEGVDVNGRKRKR
ncbi:DivIVA domain-containing protein [Acutalibacter intestini]|uniref:DivIVA domain-containing protein n=1 Tax=Acutalibacter intestini TaxID=3093659 RepID=UPI002AC9C28D|nr:DivIVA domain-containing protein [Acutalibacter sp. M00204]